MKVIKEIIKSKEYKRLMSFVEAEDIRRATKDNMLKAFTLLYYTGVRVNELLQLKNSDIRTLIETGELIIFTKKTNRERKIHFSPEGIKAIKKVFDRVGFSTEPDEAFVIRSKGNLYKSPHHTNLVKSVNSLMQECLGERYSSHSFRRGIITEMAERSINPKIIQAYIGHSNVQTTLEYIVASDNSIKNALVR